MKRKPIKKRSSRGKQRHTLQWFKNRIGKRIYRQGGGCTCAHCIKSTTEGVLITTEYNHAEYLYDCQNELDLEYSDKKL